MAGPFPGVLEDRMPSSREFDLSLRPRFGALYYVVRKPKPVAVDDPGFDRLLVLAQGAGISSFFDLETCRVAPNVFQVSTTRIGSRR